MNARKHGYGQRSWQQTHVRPKVEAQPLSHGVNRLTAISNIPSASGSPVIGFAYHYNDANQRTAITNSDATFWLFTYDSLGQVTSGKKYWPDGTPVAGQQFEYTFDDIGNRKTASSGGDAAGGDLHTQSYSANNLNQYASRSVPGFVQSLGTASTNAAVTLWGSGNEYQKAYRHGEYFWAELAYDNSLGALWIGLINFGVLPGGTNADIVASTKGHTFLPQTPEGFSYDYDGNLTADGQWNYTWDGENRLIKMAARTSVGPQISLQFDYDSQGRRLRKRVWDNATWFGAPTNDIRFAYDGWNLVAESDPTASPIRTYMSGLDLFAGPLGAAGAGGILEVACYGLTNTNCALVYDGNGNVIALVSASDGTVLAQYDYGPFAETLRAIGPMANTFPIRFSTKPRDTETDLLYYGYRYYDPASGRWLERDPLGERSDSNLNSFVRNDSIGRCDALGLTSINHDHYTTTFFQYFDYEEDWNLNVDPNSTIPDRWHIKWWSIPPPTIRHDPESCCWRMGVHGRALILWNSSDWPDGAHTQHEYHHLDIFKSVYRDMAEFVFPAAFPCITKKQLDCLSANIQRIQKAYLEEAHLENQQWHVDGGYPVGSDGWRWAKEWVDQNQARITSELAQAKAAFSTCRK